MTKRSAAAFIQGTGLGAVMGSQIVGYEYLEPVYVVLVAGVVLLVGMLLEIISEQKKGDSDDA